MAREPDDATDPSVLERRLAYLTLLERAASAANTLDKLEDAAQVVLDEVCKFTGWPVGHLYVSAGARSDVLFPTNVWHLDDAERFESLCRVTESMSLARGEELPGRILDSGRPAWIQNVQEDPNFLRASVASDLGLTAAFAFPIPSGHEVAAVVEFFSLEPTDPGAEFVEAMAGVGTQLGRVVDRQRAMDARRQSEDRFRALAQSAKDAIVTADTDGTIVSWNPAAERIFGRTETDAVGQPLTVLMPPSYRDAHLAGLHRFLSTGRSTLIGHTVEVEGLRADGSEFPLEVSLSTWEAPEGRFFAAIIRDLTDRIEVEEQRRVFAAKLAEKALHDDMTGLPNRALLLDRMEEALARATMRKSTFAVFCLDLDMFKTVNDRLGRERGDDLLKAVASRLRTVSRPGDTLARIGGDEFALLWEDVPGREGTLELGTQLMALFEEEFEVGNERVLLSTSGGVAIAEPTEGREEQHAEMLLREANAAMYRAKKAGRNRFEVFDEAMLAAVARRQASERDLRLAIDRNELTVHYQPIVALATGGLAGVEALVRWQHPTRGLLQPGQFISLAEEAGLIGDLGRWVLKESCRQAASWEAARRGQFTLSVNVSVHQFQEEVWADEVAMVLSAAGLEPPQLVIEITESVLAQDTDTAARRLDQLRDLGVRVAIDDFGTGYSSLGYLRQLPVDILKIDKSFIDGVTQGPHESALARAVVKLTKTLGLTAVAEGIEHEEQLVRLRRLGCQYGQGYYLGRPQPAEVIDELLRGRTTDSAL